MRGAFIGMKWFRTHIKHGSRLALFALAIQFVLSFGHFHAANAQTAPADSAIESVQLPTDSSHTPDQHPADNCAICAVLALAGTALFATPPVLLLPQAAEFLYLATDAEFIHLGAFDVAFQPRAPPVS
ncbi:N-acetylglucosamine kinase-like BadF-type ATPase [Nitrobacteraceae bacterium AZCC 2161]